MYYGDPEVLQPLATLAGRDEDLFQELQFHLWQVESDQPTNTRSWLLQNCWFHARHLLRTRQRAERRYEPLTEDDAPELVDESDFGHVRQIVHVRDLLPRLRAMLQPRKRLVLECLIQGYGVREIAELTGMPKSSVGRYRKSIASCAMQLGVTPPVTLLGATSSTEWAIVLVKS